jgi:glutamate synthase domain-containing protein 1
MSEESKKKTHHEEKPLEKMTVKDLKELAMEIPHEHDVAVNDMNKEQLVAFIKQGRGIKEEAPEKKKKKVIKKRAALTKQEIKAEIRRLKNEKVSVLGQEDKKKITILRRRISRLKKQSRKVA